MNHAAHTPPEYIPRSTPWGHPDTMYRIAPGWVNFCTPSHGGYWLHPSRNTKVPLKYRQATFCGQGLKGFYEEDCDWCIPVLVFRDEFRAYCDAHGLEFHKQIAWAEQAFAQFHEPKLGKMERNLTLEFA